MVKTTLVDQDIDVGRELIAALEREGLRPEAALWFYSPESETYRLILASAMVDREGARQAYAILRTALATLPQDSGARWWEVHFVSPRNELIRRFRRAERAGHVAEGQRLLRAGVDATFVDDAYVYRLH
jgi:hypothetical protein